MAKIHINNPKQVINGGAKKYYFKVKGLGGSKGDKGDKGDTGSQGPQGPQGNAATISVGSTTTLPVGYDATVENVGSIYNAVLNFGIPQGPRGPQGATGAKGDKGDKGDQGNPGPQGEKGTNATVTVGTTTTTEPGTQAYAWNSSSNPNNAVINFDIPRGATGPQGPQGAQGPTGPAGADGKSFTPVVVSSLPSTGTEGKLYLTPKNYTTGTATGNPITISLGEDAGQIDSFQLDGDTFQQTYTGKNLFNADTETLAFIDSNGNLIAGSTWSCSDYIKVSPNTTYVWHGEQTGSLGGQVIWAGYDSSQAFISGQYAQVNNTTSVSFTTGASTEYVRVGYRNDRLDNMQFELGSTASSFEPYVGGTPSPNPDYPQPIQTVTGEQTIRICGRNIYDKSKDLVGYALTGDGVETALGAWHISDYIPVVGGETYIVTGMTTPGGTAKTCYYDSAKNLIEAVPQRTSPYTITPPSGSAYVRLSIFNLAAQHDSNTLQIELGSTAHNYEAYSGTDCPLNLGTIELCKLGTYQDYIYKDGDDWKVHKATAKTILDSSSFGGWSSTTAAGGYFRGSSAQIGFPSDACFCNRLSPRTGAHGSYEYIYTQPTAIGAVYIQILATRLESADTTGFNNWINSVKPILYYTLTTPTDTTITDTDLIAQLEAIRTASLQASNTITNTATGSNLAGDMELGYYEYEPNNRYDKWLWLDLNNNYEKLGS